MRTARRWLIAIFASMLTAVLAETVSDSGRIIAGQATDSAGALRAVRWRCE